MRGELFDEIITVKVDENSQKAVSLNQKSYFGKLNENNLELSLIEAFYLMENGRLNIYQNNKKLEESYLLDLIKEKESYNKYLVFKDLKDRGYIIKTGFKYGSEFRLYERGKSPGNGHSDYLVKIIDENQEIPALNFSSYIRVSHGVNKSLLLAIIDEETDITYYKVEWIRP